MHKNTRRLLSIAAVAGLALTGCTKPQPAITIWSGVTSLNTDPICWAGGNDTVDPSACAAEILRGDGVDGATLFEAAAGNTVGFSVDPEIAEAGWNILVEGAEGQPQPITPAPLTSTYYRFTFPSTGAEGLPLQIVAGTDGQIEGIWSFRITPVQP
jgi:hypothetical protein